MNTKKKDLVIGLGLGLMLAVSALLMGAGTSINGSRTLQSTQNFCADAGSTDAYACNIAPALAAYVSGACYTFKANTANTGAASIAFNGLSAITIVKAAGGITTTLADNDIRVGQYVNICYDGTNMQMQSTLGNAASVSPSTVILAPVAIGSIAAAGTAGRLYPWFTDSPLTARDNGASWDYALPAVGPITRPPAASGYTLVNSQTVTEQEGGWLVSGASGTFSIRMAYRTSGYPGSTFEFTIGMTPTTPADFSIGAIAQSDGTKFTTFGCFTDTARGNNALWCGGYDWTNSTTFSANVGVICEMRGAPLVFLSLSDDLSATQVAYVSNDINNLHQCQIVSRSRTAFMTPTRIGVSASTANSPGNPAQMIIRHWTGI